MMTEITRFIQARHIDSFHKLRVLFFFHKYAGAPWTRQQIARQLYLGDEPLLEEIITELQAAGLVDCEANQCKLNDEAELRLPLQQLVNICKNPLTRQEILDQVRHSAPFIH